MTFDSMGVKSQEFFNGSQKSKVMTLSIGFESQKSWLGVDSDSGNRWTLFYRVGSSQNELSQEYKDLGTLMKWRRRGIFSWKGRRIEGVTKIASISTLVDEQKDKIPQTSPRYLNILCTLNYSTSLSNFTEIRRKIESSWTAMGGI